MPSSSRRNGNNRRRSSASASAQEYERFLHMMFQSTANQFSGLYSQSINQQKLAFNSGEKYAYLKFQEWISEKIESGNITVADIHEHVQTRIQNWIPSVDLPVHIGGFSVPHEAFTEPQVSVTPYARRASARHQIHDDDADEE